MEIFLKQSGTLLTRAGRLPLHIICLINGFEFTECIDLHDI